MSKAKIIEQKGIAKIVIHFEDGATKEVNQGMIISLEPKDDEELTMNIECCHIDGKNYQNIMYGLLSLASETYIEEEI